MSNTKTLQAFEFDYTTPHMRQNAKQELCRHKWRGITHFHPDYPHITVDEEICHRCGLIKE